MTNYEKLVKALRDTDFGDACDYCEHLDMCKDDDCIILQAADAIEALQAENPIVETVLVDKMRQQMEELQQKWFKSETDATNLTGKLAQAEADIDRLNLEIDKRIATEIELSNQVDALQAEIRESMQKCAECGDEQEQKVKELQARLGEAENSVERWKDMYLTKHEPKRGEWVRVEDGESYHYECSECGERPLYSRYGDVVLSGVCPMCGAKMEVQG